MNKKEMLLSLIDHYTKGNKSQFSSKLGISAQGLSTWLSRGTFDIETIYSKCEGVNPEWLISGKGNMLISQNENENKQSDIDGKNVAIMSNNNIHYPSTIDRLIEENSKMLDLIQEQVRNNQDQFIKMSAIIEKLIK